MKNASVFTQLVWSVPPRGMLLAEFVGGPCLELQNSFSLV